jgi:integrase
MMRPMASIQPRGNRHQLRVKHKLLDKPFFFTFDTEAQAQAYGEQLEALLARGIVPTELLAAPERTAGADPLVAKVILDYSKDAAITRSDDALLLLVRAEVKEVRVSGITFAWCQDYVTQLKRKANLSPGTIRKRVGALGRVIDWHIRQTTPVDTHPRVNPLRLLPRGYSAYSDADKMVQGVVPKRDKKRDRRLGEDELTRIQRALAGEKREDRERALVVDPAFGLLFDLIVDTGLRLFEAYRLRVSSIDLVQNIINVEGSKGHRGEIKPRVVPIKRGLREPLRAFCAGREGLIFPFWDGTEAGRLLATNRLSKRFAALFQYAQVPEFTEHDLRHEATCRWFELRNAGGWVFSEIEVCRIMGWSDTRMALRYASLRGSDLSARLD